jgi:lysophospholipase L1-like esterase
MKRSVAVVPFAIIALLCSLSARGAEPLLKDRDLLAICGDSITEQKLYSVFIEDYLLMCKPAAEVQAVQFGWSGEVAPGFLSRMGSDCFVFKPTIATTFYGMNDGGYAALTPERSKKYHDAIHGIVETFKKAGVSRIVVGSPGVVDSYYFRRVPTPMPEEAGIYNKTLAQLSDLAKDVAEEEHVTFADVNGIMMDTMKKAKAKLGEKYEFAGRDGVHPGPNGHLVTAYAFLKALGCDGNIGTITLDMGGGKASATPGHTVVSSDSSSAEIESSRYPFCFFGEPGTPAATNEVIQFMPFNQDLNRFMLVVTNGSAEKMKVTWGSASKEFSKGDLEKGINLAAEFLDNPFCAQFQKVEATIRSQQNYETPTVKEMLHRIPQFEQLLPEEKESFQKIIAGAVAKDAKLRETAAAAVTPVRHTIKVQSAP